MIAARHRTSGDCLLIEAIGATTLAALTVLSWIAIGTLVVRPLDPDDAVALPSYVLAGSGITAFVLAIFSLAGMVAGGTIATAAGSLAVLLARRKQVGKVATSALRSFRGVARPRMIGASAGLALVLVWLSAIAPPRSADAMRYHLAHIRLIVVEGRWTRIPDFHFALPFGWSLSFLPFELLGMPQGSQLLSLALLVMLSAGLIRALPPSASALAISMAILLPLMHPFVLRGFSEAGADPYAIFVVFVVALLLARFAEQPGENAALAGFASWIGIQSRYQMVAVAISAGIVFVALLRHQSSWKTSVIQYALGSAAALVLAAPFYVMNFRWFGNPVWPLMISRPTAESSYTDLVAWHYGRSLTGPHTIETIGQSVLNLITWNRLVPLALVIVAAVVLAAVSRDRRLRTLGVFGCVFLLLWAVAQPFLYPKFILLVLPVALLVIGFKLDSTPRVFSRNLSRLVQMAAVALVTASVILSRDVIAYALTNNSGAYHEHTWFYPVYDWVNRSTPRRSRVLVMVSSGMTYYLDRPYRRADPWIGGAIDWRRVNDARKLASSLRDGEFTHLIYEERDWSMFPGGSEMKAAVTQAVEQGELTPLRSFDERLYTSRARRSYRETRVTIFEVRRERQIAESAG